MRSNLFIIILICIVVAIFWYVTRPDIIDITIEILIIFAILILHSIRLEVKKLEEE